MSQSNNHNPFVYAKISHWIYFGISLIWFVNFLYTPTGEKEHLE